MSYIWALRQMNGTDNMSKKNITLGILAHVDAGKTTLSEALLYHGGTVRSVGRVDHGNAFLDTDKMEKNRGITIFAKQASFETQAGKYTILDTPGHVDFSPEMERTLSVLDYAILVVSATSGVQSHTKTVWRLLEKYHVPVVLFVNKMDQSGADRDSIVIRLQKELSGSCVPFDQKDEAWQEEIAMCDEALLDAYMENGEIDETCLPQLTSERKLFPVFLGSALKLTGVDKFMAGLDALTKEKEYPSEFGARVFKIAREGKDRLTYVRITGGSLKVRSELGTEKITQIRMYQGQKFQTIDEAQAGMVVALTGLANSYQGQGFGFEKDQVAILEPVMDYAMLLPEGADPVLVYQDMKQFAEEDPTLSLSLVGGQIHVKLMGLVQLEILTEQIAQRLNLAVSFGSGRIVYKETIQSMAEGVGHYEPLRHYAEVHILLEPAERGSGLIIGTDVSTDDFDLNWQRLVMTHMLEREHPGVLTGSSITDIKMTLVAGKAHLKHTEGGDMRQATYRAIRQGLMMTEPILLEPYYAFTLQVPDDCVGRAMSDIGRMEGKFTLEGSIDGVSTLVGRAPVVCMMDYMTQVSAYTKGLGNLMLRVDGYDVCHNPDEVLSGCSYNPEEDAENQVGSIFCSHGAGHYVNWDEVYNYMHLPLSIGGSTKRQEELQLQAAKPQEKSQSMYGSWESDKELAEIFEKTFGATAKNSASGRGDMGYEVSQAVKQENIRKAAQEYKESHASGTKKETQKHYMLVDGYNVIFASKELKELTNISLDAARGALMDKLCNFQGYEGCELIVVFDAYKVKGNPGSVEKYHNIYVVYTKEAETADMYIEKATKQMGHKEYVTVVTNDALEQLIVIGHGAVRISSRELLERMQME